MRSQIILNAIAKAGGFFFTDLLDESDKETFLKYLRRNDLADVLSRSYRQEFGYLFKLKDELIRKDYPYDARKMTYYKTHKDSSIERSSRFHVSDFKLYHSFVKYCVWKKYYLSVITKNNEKKFFEEYNVFDHKDVGRSLCYAYDYVKQKVVVVVMDFDKSLKTILNIIEIYNDERYRMIIATLKPSEMLEDDIYRKLNSKIEGPVFKLDLDIEVTNFEKINSFFGV